MKKIDIIQHLICLIMILLLSINVSAASVSDNDGSAFITKAEFDALKSSFQSQIDTYNQNIDSKIDEAIAAYLSGISITRYRDIRLDVNQNLEFPIYSCVGKESSKHTYKESGDIRFDLSLPNIETQNASIQSSNNSTTSDDVGLRIFSDHNTGVSYNNNSSGIAIIDLTLTLQHSDPRPGNYEVAAYDTSTNKWRTKGYKNGYIKSGSEYKVQDLTISRSKNALWRSGVYKGINANFDSDYHVYVYANFAGPASGNLKNTTNSTTLTKWFGDQIWNCVAAGWASGANPSLSAPQRAFYENFTGKNLSLDDYKQSYVDSGWTYNSNTNVHNLDINTSSVRARIETDKKRNKIYSGSNAYVNAFPESNIWCYNPAKIGGEWKSDEYTISQEYRNLMFVSNYSKIYDGYAVMPYSPHWPVLVPALDGDTDDINYGQNARFSIINADKLYWTDDNGDEHKFNEGLFITKFTDDGGLTGKFKFSEASNEKVWCAFSKKPFDGTWTNADALPVTVKVADVKQTITNFQYECGKEYAFTLENISKNDKVYMLFKSSGGSKNPSLDYLKDLQIITSD